DFILKGWYTDEALTTPFDFDTPITADITLYAKWGLPIVELGGHEDGTLGTQFDRVWFSNSWWRILKADMDTDATNGNQALILKEQALTKEEIDVNAVDNLVKFDTTATNWMDPYFHNVTTATGYGESHLKAVIDSYYNMAIAPTYSNYVLPVDLDLPNWTRYRDNILFERFHTGGQIGYNNWSWQNKQSWFTDARFATSLTNLTNDSGITNDVNALKQQAFALSYGDIQTLDKNTFYEYKGGLQSNLGQYNTLLDISDINAIPLSFWIRSAGSASSTAGDVGAGTFVYSNGISSAKLPVRPALAIQLD
ncbi:MAG: InlB B-repeat-containing protein, partial [Lactococcus chungangensis]|nr:InlB B-repeat-containing protein [Lactococcus chungangensis]